MGKENFIDSLKNSSTLKDKARIFHSNSIVMRVIYSYCFDMQSIMQNDINSILKETRKSSAIDNIETSKKQILFNIAITYNLIKEEFGLVFLYQEHLKREVDKILENLFEGQSNEKTEEIKENIKEHVINLTKESELYSLDDREIKFFNNDLSKMHNLLETIIEESSKFFHNDIYMELKNDLKNIPKRKGAIMVPHKMDKLDQVIEKLENRISNLEEGYNKNYMSKLCDIIHDAYKLFIEKIQNHMVKMIGGKIKNIDVIEKYKKDLDYKTRILMKSKKVENFIEKTRIKSQALKAENKDKRER